MVDIASTKNYRDLELEDTPKRRRTFLKRMNHKLQVKQALYPEGEAHRFTNRFGWTGRDADNLYL